MYYNHPLKAAWMARELNVKFIGTSLVISPDWSAFFWYKENSERTSFIGPWLVSPDSLHIFDPMEGDLVSVPWFDINGKESSRGYGMVDGDHDVVMDGESIGASGLGDVDSIIQRNGKAFFMPEVEA